MLYLSCKVLISTTFFVVTTATIQSGTRVNVTFQKDSDWEKGNPHANNSEPLPGPCTGYVVSGCEKCKGRWWVHLENSHGGLKYFSFKKEQMTVVGMDEARMLKLLPGRIKPGDEVRARACLELDKLGCNFEDGRVDKPLIWIHNAGIEFRWGITHSGGTKRVSMRPGDLEIISPKKNTHNADPTGEQGQKLDRGIDALCEELTDIHRKIEERRRSTFQPPQFGFFNERQIMPSDDTEDGKRAFYKQLEQIKQRYEDRIRSDRELLEQMITREESLRERSKEAYTSHSDGIRRKPRRESVQEGAHRTRDKVLSYLREGLKQIGRSHELDDAKTLVSVFQHCTVKCGVRESFDTTIKKILLLTNLRKNSYYAQMTPPDLVQFICDLAGPDDWSPQAGHSYWTKDWKSHPRNKPHRAWYQNYDYAEQNGAIRREATDVLDKFRMPAAQRRELNDARDDHRNNNYKRCHSQEE